MAETRIINHEQHRAETLRGLIAALLPNLGSNTQLTSAQLIDVAIVGNALAEPVPGRFGVVLPLIQILGGSDTLETVYHAIRDTARWWP